MPGRQPRVRWVFREFDTRGGPIGPPRHLFEEFGLQSDEGVRLEGDPDRNRYLITWAGAGPEGPGVYVLPIVALP